MSATTTTTTCSRAAAAAFHRPTLIKNFAPTKAAPAARAALKKRAQLRGIGLVAQSELDDGGNSSLGKATTSAAEVGDDSDVNDDEKSSNQRGASLSSRERLRQALNEEIDGAMREVSRAQTEEERRPAAAAAAVAPEIKQIEIRRRGRFLSTRGRETAENEERVGRTRTSRERTTSDEDEDDDREKEKAIVFCA